MNTGGMQIPCDCGNSACGCTKTYHAACQGNAVSGLGADCGTNVCGTGLDATAKEEILKLHNDARAKVAAGQTDMPSGTIPDLVWDDNLAAGAQVGAVTSPLLLSL